MPRLPVLLLVSLLFVWGAAPLCAEVDEATLMQLEQRLQAMDRALEEAALGGSASLGGLWREGMRYREQAQGCVQGGQQALAESEADLQVLGEPSGHESLQVLAKRTELKARKGEISARLDRCRLIVLRSSELAERAAALRDSSLTRHLSERRSPIWVVLGDGLWMLPRDTVNLPQYLLDEGGLGELGQHQRATLLFLALFGLLFGWLLRPLVAPHHGLPDDPASGPWLSYGLRLCLARRLPALLLLGLPGLYLAFGNGPTLTLPMVAEVAVALAGALATGCLLRALLGPCGELRINPYLDERVALRLRRLTLPLLWLLMGGYLLFYSGLAGALAPASEQLVRAIYTPLLLLNLLLLFVQLGALLPLMATARLRVVFALLLVGILFTEWLGYLNLAQFLFVAFSGSLLVLGATLFLSNQLDETLDGLDEGRLKWHQRLRSILAIAPGKGFHGRLMIRLVVTILLWGGAVLLISRFWGLSGRGSELLFSYLFDGFALGSLTVVPTKLLLAVVVMLLISAATRSFKRQLERRWLRYTNLDRGAREATVTLSGYLGNGIAVLVALTVAGVEFSHLAIIAGALSVGIGFGLQNVVNNFVSGLILLFERPVRTGDWIVVGGTEGYVRQISIRSTIIQTFDRADVIVPNSELISGQVTNWMLRDQFGRAKVPIGVAYGSDTQKVKQILLKVAMSHPGVVIDGSMSPPWVLFRGFGDSALDFELRCYISNVDNRLTIISDLNFAIDDAFRAEGIEIPFPQRDVHVRSMPGGF